MAAEERLRGVISGDLVVLVPDERSVTPQGLLKRYRFLRRGDGPYDAGVGRQPAWEPMQLLGSEEVGPSEWPLRRWERERPRPPSPF